MEFAARLNLGYMHYLAGNLPRSLELMPTVEQAASDHYKGVVGINRSKVLLSAGLVADADRALVEASAALERTEMVTLLAEAELARAEVALLAGNYHWLKTSATLLWHGCGVGTIGGRRLSVSWSCFVPMLRSAPGPTS